MPTLYQQERNMNQNTRAADDSIVYHVDILDEQFRAAFTLPWVFETDDAQLTFATEAEACAAQRAYRQERGFDPMTGLPV